MVLKFGQTSSRPSGTFRRSISTQDCVPQALTYLGYFSSTSHKIVILSEAPHRFIAWYSAGRGVEGPRGALILLMPLAPFQPPKPAPGGPATVQRFGTGLGMEDDYSA